MNAIAIITARGGSKRIPRKNIREFCGQPIIKYSIDAALSSNLFDEVMVSTDDEEIAYIAKQNGAKVPFMRSTRTSDDFATTADVIEEVLTEYKKVGREYEFACCIYPTAPFISSKVLGNAMQKLIESNADSVLPVVGFSFPPQRGFIIQNAKLIMKWPEHQNCRSQDLEKMYHDCGQFYCLRTCSFEKYHSLVMENTLSIILPEVQVQDIDSEEDWLLAEMKYRLFHDRYVNGW